ncbi:hypothetical protein GWK87_01235 [Staphylococcus schleiferi subsp. coagulans]|uniref:hypothetical protein n=1 Tax=Staphylococcus coagulans TaxID=74706 RepID=UPI0015FD5CB9|nr:hypothetical protein [Staphylococcus coagulans]MBA8758950.1 hypothetical protein [Staphylococcus coagulans]MBA8768271.1 hypothetical protein [Staphylococcus coagulans]
MKKRMFASLGLTLLLTGCGSQNLLPLEEKSTDLSDKNHDLKLENQELKNENHKKQKQLDALKKDSENTGQAKTNQKIADYLQISSKYYGSVTKTINDYQAIDNQIMKNKKDQDVMDQLDGVIEAHDDAINQYKESVNDLSIVKKDDNVKKQHKQVLKVQKDIKTALTEIKKGYAKKDLTSIQRGRQNLTNIQVKNDNLKQN